MGQCCQSTDSVLQVEIEQLKDEAAARLELVPNVNNNTVIQAACAAEAAAPIAEIEEAPQTEKEAPQTDEAPAAPQTDEAPAAPQTEEDHSVPEIVGDPSPPQAATESSNSERSCTMTFEHVQPGQPAVVKDITLTASDRFPLGMSYSANMHPNMNPIVIVRVAADSIAEAAGVKIGMRLLKLDGLDMLQCDFSTAQQAIKCAAKRLTAQKF